MELVCEECETPVNSSPDLKLIPNATERMSADVLDVPVFCLCGHIFHLGCLCEYWFSLISQKSLTSCPVCHVACDTDSIIRLYNLRKSDSDTDTSGVGEEELIDGKQNEGQRMQTQTVECGVGDSFHIRHSIFATIACLIAIKTCLILTEVEKYPGTDIDDEDIENFERNPPWILNFYLGMAYVVLLTGTLAVLIDIAFENYRSKQWF